jgi:hypothetical protein
MKKCPPSLAIKELKTKTTLRFHLTPVRIAILKTPQQLLVRMWGKGNPHTLLVGVQASTTTVEKKIGDFLKI